ncbi:nischarin-like [Gadus morhua]|uniref:nischarin-like n=1 Tax=Gadus morhua TaxID=8049 RepID=UPI0011B660E2|nr:nischarin-like [Gadus morhua]
MREKRREKEEGKRSGSAARTGKKWKFFAVLSFLDPFVTPRETSSNLPRCAEMEVEIEDDGAAETSGVGEADEERDEAAAAAGPSHNTDQLSGNESDPVDVPAAAATAATPAPAAGPVPAAGPGPAPAPSPPSGRKRASGVPCGNTPIQEAILQALQRDGELCADAEFLNGLLPSLKRLPPDAKEYVKFQIHKVIFDATQFTLNLEPV